jgi:sulfite reductase alpha subunit-like flavoprotein
MQPKSPSTSRSSMSTRSPDPERSALILYGTETGNAQEVAEELGALTERLRFATHVAELNQSKPVSTVEPQSR